LSPEEETCTCLCFWTETSRKNNSDMCRLTTGFVLRNASLGDFVVVRTSTYTNLDITV